ncbi:heparan-alpha-glucosaminide N-acetyltransferase isoform X4 [Eutrema salsugineum]|uniref:heparan-alpha-glucosaminide N-acetyltransferase isoform X4 n=1 Tax=Eutrema salsugineum TaxID=72664 RepID=UPI000CECFF5A|nr:heparan-alpha-glucosaminide N-acetyltransferase isoform X4 [Eutrema salsugineum]
MRTKLAMYEPIKGCDGDDQWREKKDIESALQISRPSLPPDKERLVSLDVFRGLTVALMILVDDVGGVFPAINHSPWDGVTLADFVMPFFLFIVGVSLAFAYKNLSCRYAATRKALFRSFKLLLLGLFLQGGFIHGLNSLSYGIDVEKIRLMGILQRIAIAYLVAALCEIWLKGNHNVSSELSMIKKYRFHWVVAFVITTIYLSLLYGLYVPDWEYQISTEDQGSTLTTFLNLKVKCGVRGHTGPGCNAVGMLDRMLLGIHHLYRKPVYLRTKQCSVNYPDNGPLPPGAPSWCQAPFDPEGLLSSLMATVTCLVGLHYGHIIIHFKVKNVHIIIVIGPQKASESMDFAFFLSSDVRSRIGSLWRFWIPVIRDIPNGLVDVYGYKRASLVLEWMGIHALTIYVLIACNLVFLIIHGFYWKKPINNLLHLIGIGK